MEVTWKAWIDSVAAAGMTDTNRVWFVDSHPMDGLGIPHVACDQPRPQRRCLGRPCGGAARAGVQHPHVVTGRQ